MSGRETLLDVEGELIVEFYGSTEVSVGECEDILEVIKGVAGERIRILVERVSP